jgi:hypothetical protein
LPEGGEVAAVDFDALQPKPVEDFAQGAMLVAHPGQLLDMGFHEVELGGHALMQFLHARRL